MPRTAQRKAVSADDLRIALAAAGPARRDDLRFGPLLGALAADAGSVAEALTPLVDGTKARRPAELAALVREAVRIDRLTLAEDLRDVALRLMPSRQRGTADRNVVWFAQRYGAGGADESRTLQSIATPYGVTRERVRQVTEQMLARLEGRSVSSPAFARIAEALPPLLPRSEADLTDKLRPLLGSGMTLSAAIRYATSVLGASVPAQLVHFRDTLVAVDSRRAWQAADEELLKIAFEEAVAMMRGCGMAYLPRVSATVTTIVGAPISTAAVQGMLGMLHGFEWIGDGGEWFWFTDQLRQNRLVNLIRKVMCVARGAIDIEELYGGICRLRRDAVKEIGLFPPPRWAVQEFCQRLSFLDCKQSNNFVCAEPIDCKEALSESELMMHAFMCSQGGIASRRELTRALVDAGKCEPITLTTTIASTPIIRQIDRAVFQLRGWPLDAKALQRAQANVGADAGSADVRCLEWTTKE